jgi:hypothetical protein
MAGQFSIKQDMQFSAVVHPGIKSALMKGNIQLRIPAPCSESWENMRPEDKGRFCGACSKTVVDFSMMTDAEIIGYLSRAGQHVCGRLAGDQLNRGIALQPDAAGPSRRWWTWLLAGLLISSEAKAQRLPEVTVTAAPKTTVRKTRPVIGLMVMSRELPDSLPVKDDSIKVKELPAVVVKGYPTMGKVALTGAVMAVSSICSKTGPVTQWLKDTLTTIGLLPNREWSVYPNPARRGSPVMLAWQTMQTGNYEVGLFNTQGELIQSRVLQVENKGQIDLLDIPASLSAGSYFLRVTSAGSGKPVTRTLLVL